METSTLYRKQGRRYFPERYWQGEAFPTGAFLVVVNETNRSRTELTARVENVKPDFLALKAAAMSLEDRLTKIISKATEARCNNVITPKQKEAWEALRKTGLTTVYTQSRAMMAKEILEAITEASNEPDKTNSRWKHDAQY